MIRPRTRAGLVSVVAVLVAAGTAVSAPTAATTDTESAEAPPIALEALPQPPAVSAKAWAVYDGVDGTRIAGVDPSVERPIASLTKLMTALVVTKRTTGDEKVRVTKDALEVGDGAALGMKAGQTYPVDTLLKAMLVYSANDAALALAQYVGNDEEGFLELMNEEADNLELNDSTFTSVTGLDGDNPDELTKSTPSELVELAEVAMKDPRIRDAVRMETVKVDRPGAESIVLENRNPLLGAYAGIDGVKTGHTDAAGYCLLAHYDDDQERELWVVVLGSASEKARAADVAALLDWAVELRQNVQVATAGDPVGWAPVAGSSREVELFISEDITVSVRVGEKLTERYVMPVPVEPPFRAGDEVGRLEIVVDGEVTAESPIYVAKGRTSPGPWAQFAEAARDWRSAVREGRHEVTRAARRLRRESGF